VLCPLTDHVSARKCLFGGWIPKFVGFDVGEVTEHVAALGTCSQFVSLSRRHKSVRSTTKDAEMLYMLRDKKTLSSG
jgi:hypothetical protein